VEALLSVKNLNVKALARRRAGITIINGISFEVMPGEIVGIIGESGCGKTTAALALMRLLPKHIYTISGHIFFQGVNLLSMPSTELRKIRGNEISMIFQDPTTSLNPTMKIITQMRELFALHRRVSKEKARFEAIQWLERVEIPGASQRIECYPHQLSGGMRQRVMIAMALLCKPKLVIADEPTTALDVSVQAQILELISRLQRELQMALILISHNLGVMAGTAEKIIVMYAGEIVECASTVELFSNPLHPYTCGLLRSVPRFDEKRESLAAIPGRPPDFRAPPLGCRFGPRCKFSREICFKKKPPSVSLGEAHLVSCWNYVKEH